MLKAWRLLTAPSSDLIFEAALFTAEWKGWFLAEEVEAIKQHPSGLHHWALLWSEIFPAISRRLGCVSKSRLTETDHMKLLQSSEEHARRIKEHVEWAG